jgi:drug/metabolite transporter (DMT)-like permease
LVRKRWTHAVTAILVLGSFGATYLMLDAMQNIDQAVFTTAKPISEQYGTKRLEAGESAPPGAETAVVTYQGEQVTVVRGILPLGTPVRLTTPFFNIYGLLTLVGGAIWSAFLFWRKRVLPNRVTGNVLIAAGALLIGFASTLTRLGHGQYLYLGELVSAVMMFAGFQVASGPQIREESPSKVVAASAD